MLEHAQIQDDYEVFVEKFKMKTGINLHLYKEQQMRRRLDTFRKRGGYKTFVDYFNAMISDTNILNEFLDHITINFSEFFRNEAKWNILKSQILPQITERKRHLQAWSAACSTGEEPYSLAMMLSDLRGITFDIYATDIDQQVLNRATRGTYSKSSIGKVPKQFVHRFFDQTSTGEYQITASISRSITFSKHNLLADPYRSGFDLIICRNVMIYFKEDIKEQLIQKFSQSLEVGGVLFVGGTEHIREPRAFGLETTSDTFFYRKARK